MEKLKENWRALNDDMRDYFFYRCLLIILLLIASICTFFFVKPLSAMCFTFLICCSAWLLYVFILCMRGMIFLYEGCCVKKNEKKFDMQIGFKKTSLYGRSTAVIKVKDNDTDDYVNLIIPVGFSYDIHKGYLVRIYAIKGGLFQKNANTFSLPNPLLIRIAKSCYEDAEDNEEIAG